MSNRVTDPVNNTHFVKGCLKNKNYYKNGEEQFKTLQEDKYYT